MHLPVLRASFILTAQKGDSAIGENVPRSKALNAILKKGAMATYHAQPKKYTEKQIFSFSDALGLVRKQNFSITALCTNNSNIIMK